MAQQWLRSYFRVTFGLLLGRPRKLPSSYIFGYVWATFGPTPKVTLGSLFRHFHCFVKSAPLAPTAHRKARGRYSRADGSAPLARDEGNLPRRAPPKPGTQRARPRVPESGAPVSGAVGVGAVGAGSRVGGGGVHRAQAGL